MQHSRLAAFWTGAGVLATLAVLPYAFAIDPSLLAQLPMPLAPVVVAQTAQTGILLLAAAGQACVSESPLASIRLLRAHSFTGARCPH